MSERLAGRRYDLVLLRALIVVALACCLMVVNRWVVARHQAGLLTNVLVEVARKVALHETTQVRQGRLDDGAIQALLADTLSFSDQFLAAALVDRGRITAQRGRADLSPEFAHGLGNAGDGDYLDADGRAGPAPGEWALMPPATVVEAALPGERALRVLVSLQSARDEHLYLFRQAIASVAVLLVGVLLFLWWVLRQPRRSLSEASRFAEQLPLGSAARLPAIESQIVAIDAMRASLNKVADMFDARRRHQQEQDLALQESAQRAQAASEAKGRFLANMSHEIRTPLNGIIGLTDLLLEGPLNPSQRHFLGLSRQSSKHLLNVVDDILDQAKLEAGRMQVEATPFSLYEMLEEIVAPFSLAAADKGLDLFNQVCPNLPLTLVGDPLRLRQVLVNLLGNAMKFTRSGHVRLCVQATAPSSTLGSADSVSLRFEVSDTGPGIAADKLGTVLQAFGQADASTAREHGGTGLGLTISAALLRLMGSELQVHSEFGQGSCFSFEIAYPLGQAEGSRTLNEYHHWSGRRVLWIDPHDYARAWFAQVLGLWKVTVQTAATLDEAIVQLARPDAHISTVFVCGTLLGPEQAERIDALCRHAGGSTIAVMLGPREAPPRSLLREGVATLTLMKPVTPRALNHALAEEPLAAVPALAQPPVPSLAGLNVLLAEDNEVNVIVATAHLEAMGATVARAGSGSEALAMAQSRPFDVALMDLQMPGLDGHAACAALRRFERDSGRARLPVIALTAHRLDNERAQTQASGMNGFMSKPFTPGDLAREIHRVLAPGSAH
jgi:two-component system, sensor histidine kinase and response regulator